MLSQGPKKTLPGNYMNVFLIACSAKEQGTVISINIGCWHDFFVVVFAA